MLNEDFRENKKIEKVQDRHIILEIGTGDYPIILPSKKRREDLKKEGAFYIGVELSGEEIKKAAKGIEGKYPQITSKILLIEANGVNLPFSDESINEVVIGNVLGDPSVRRYPIEMIFDEIYRVLRKGGYAKIIETFTPEEGSEVLTWLIPYLQDKFEIEKTLVRESMELPDDVDQDWIEAGTKESFIYYFKKRY